YPELSSELRAARRSLEGKDGVALLSDWRWYERPRQWVLSCRLSPAVAPGSLVPDYTDWFVRASPAYPLGPIKVSPSKEGGLVATFQHQSFNGLGSADVPWRTGSLCLDTPARVLGRRAFDNEPYESGR